MAAYYNEIEPYAAQWLRNLIAKGLIADGEVDTRSIVDVIPDDLRGFVQAHFFAGIGGWSHALRLAGWPDDQPVWTGSCPCQPFSVAGKGLGADDPRHLWPHFHRLIAARRPPVVFGEQVSGAAGYGWLDGVQSDLARESYACEGFDIPACSVDAPHIRQRLYWVASDMANARREQAHEEQQRPEPDERERSSDGVGGRSMDNRKGNVADAEVNGLQKWKRENWQQDARSISESWLDASRNNSFWSDAVWLTGADGKARRAKPGVPLLAHGVSARVGRLRAYGNAIVPQVAAEVIGAYMECRP